MNKRSILALDLMRKEEIASVKGGTAATNKVCGCVCVGPVTPGTGGNSTSDSDCADCGASNAFRVVNQFTHQ